MILRGLLIALFMALSGVAWAETPGAFFAGKNGCKMWWPVGSPKYFMTVSVDWRGACRNGLAQGHGTFAIVERLEAGQNVPKTFNSTGEGDVVGGKLNGRAFYGWDKGGFRTEGEFRDGMLNGRGITTSDGEYTKWRSEGEYRDGKLNGWAVTESEDKTDRFTTHREGEYRDDAMIRGTVVSGPRGCAVQERYEGEFANGLYNGRGTLKAYNGKVYTGVWEDNSLNGKSALWDLSPPDDAKARCH